MRRLGIFAAVAAAALMGSQLIAGEKIKVPQGPSGAQATISTAIDHGGANLTNVQWRARAWRRGFYGPRFYGPYSGYYYTRPYYGYSYYAPTWGYSPGFYGVPYVGAYGWGGWW